jgi:antitoxin (DNA-binding transcriptional repressor) of toxin-antitoxin stability system
MPKTIDLHEAETRFEELVALAEASEEFVICRDGTPVVRLIPVDAKRASAVLDGDEIIARNDEGRRE